MNKRNVFIIILFAIFGLSLFFNTYKRDQIPLCINADEASQGYNSYSLLKTARDEYGSLLPLRLKSFDDFKMPLYAYLSTPFIKIWGLSKFSIRFLNLLVVLLFVPLIYLIAYELFKNKKISIISAFLVAVNPGLITLARQAHEAVLSAFFILVGVYFTLRLVETKKILYLILADIGLLLSAFSYHTGRIFLLFLIFYQTLFILKNRKEFFKLKRLIIVAAIIAITLLTPFFTDYKYGANRVKNLLFFKNAGFQMRLDEYINEHPLRPFHNKLTESAREISNRYFSQLSTDFLLIKGDLNPRFGFQNIGLITPVELLLFLVGIYFLYKNNQKNKNLIMILFLISPLGNSLTWQEGSLTRTYPMLFFILIVVAYGLYNFAGVTIPKKVKLTIFLIGAAWFIFAILGSWDIYFNHYGNRAYVYRYMQCGYQELSNYIKKNYNKFDKFYITERYGQPYIFLLFNLPYPPAKYQSQAEISSPDQYGFGQVAKFDKFFFKFHYDPKIKKAAFIGFPDEFNDLRLDPLKIKKIKIGTEEIFWIWEN